MLFDLSRKTKTKDKPQITPIPSCGQAASKKDAVSACMATAGVWHGRLVGFNASQSAGRFALDFATLQASLYYIIDRETVFLR
jgi:hypothetical protein